MSFSIGGQGSGDFKETSARVQALHVVLRNSLGLLTTDAFTQANPPVVTSQKSTTLASITKVGVLGGSIAFTRPDFGNGYHGGPNTASFAAGCVPLGLFINDAIGNPYENTPGPASGRGPYFCGAGTFGVSIYETKVQTSTLSGTPGTAITYHPGDRLYASVNGLLTNVIGDAYEANVTGQGSSLTVAQAFTTVVGVVKVVPDSTASLLVIDLRI